jgi:hypothetical protein
MTYPDIANFIKELGFPIFVTVYLLTINTKSINKLTISINSLTTFLEGKKDGN